MQNTEPKYTQRVRVEVKVMAQDLPLCCPLPNMALWNMHPRVYLAPDQDNRAVCPYCATNYVAVDE
jgi:uncharacterized Zn-finger protein